MYKRQTLGADDGIGVSVALSVLQASDLVHGPLEVLFTIDEETGMTGANGLQPGLLKGDILLNLDSEDEGELCIGCAGGADVHVDARVKELPVPATALAFQIDVVGLRLSLIHIFCGTMSRWHCSTTVRACS